MAFLTPTYTGEYMLELWTYVASRPAFMPHPSFSAFSIDKVQFRYMLRRMWHARAGLTPLLRALNRLFDRASIKFGIKS
jgi:hypothetical protein